MRTPQPLLAAALLLASAALASAQTCPGGDAFAPNHTCFSSVFLTTTSNIVEAPMTITDAEPDYFRIPLDFGVEVYVRVEFEHDEGDIDVFFFRDDQCDVGPPLRQSATDQDIEEIRWTPQFDGFIKIERNGGTAPCSNYTLSITKQASSSSFGGTICWGNPSSLGFNVTLSPTGSPAVADNNLSFGAGPFPPNTFGMLVNGPVAGFQPLPGTAGLLCLGGGIGRFNRPGEIQAANLGGMSFDVDLLDIPRPNGVIQIQPGESWGFQVWFRDTTPGGAPTSNLTDGTMVWFE